MIHGDEQHAGGEDSAGSDRYARLAGKLLADQQRDCPRVDLHRDAAIAAMAVAVAGKRHRRWAVGAVAAIVAAAAAFVFFARTPARNDARTAGLSAESALVVEHETGHGSLLVRGATTRPLPDLGTLAVGDSVRSGADSSATLAFSSGTRITLSPMGQLRVDELGTTRRFSLLGGRLQAHVAKLARGERFIVTTPDSEVEVRGTVFSVAVDAPLPSCRDSSSTSTVFVSEGAVWVRSRAKEIVLAAGETWTTPCQALGTAAETVPEVMQGGAGNEAVGHTTSQTTQAADKGSARPLSAKAPGVRVVKQAVASAASKNAPAAPVSAPAPLSSFTTLVPVSSLAEQNDLFSAAMAAERMGRHGEALGKLDELIVRFSSGPLHESARAERERILSAQNSR